jgi:translation initiation factor IF-1
MELRGVIRAQLPSGLFRVELEDRHQITAHASGTMKKNFVRILEGDRVLIELSRMDLTRGRITRKIGR